MLDSVLKEIPTLELDEEEFVGLRMQTGGGRCVPPEDLGILRRSKVRRPAPVRVVTQAGDSNFHSPAGQGVQGGQNHLGQTKI